MARPDPGTDRSRAWAGVTGLMALPAKLPHHCPVTGIPACPDGSELGGPFKVTERGPSLSSKLARRYFRTWFCHSFRPGGGRLARVSFASERELWECPDALRLDLGQYGVRGCEDMIFLDLTRGRLRAVSNAV